MFCHDAKPESRLIVRDIRVIGKLSDAPFVWRRSKAENYASANPQEMPLAPSDTRGAAKSTRDGPIRNLILGVAKFDRFGCHSQLHASYANQARSDLLVGL